MDAHRCPLCQGRFASESERDTHVRRGHALRSYHRQITQCSLCDENFSNQPQLVMHIASRHSDNSSHCVENARVRHIIIIITAYSIIVIHLAHLIIIHNYFFKKK